MVKDLKNKADKNEEEAKISAIWEVRPVQCFNYAHAPLGRCASNCSYCASSNPTPSFTFLLVSFFRSSFPPPFLIIIKASVNLLDAWTRGEGTYFAISEEFGNLDKHLGTSGT